MAINTQKIRQKAKKNQGIILIFFLIVVVGGFVAYRQYSVWTDKQKFEKAQASIDTLYADIVVRLGPPNNYEHNQSCGRPNQKFEQGPLSCNVGLHFVYAVSSRDEGDILFDAIYSIASSRTDIIQSISSPESKLRESSVGNSLSTWTSAYNQFIEKSSGLKCVMKSVYDTPEDTFLELKNSPDKKNFYTTIGCADKARRGYYPIH